MGRWRRGADRPHFSGPRNGNGVEAGGQCATERGRGKVEVTCIARGEFGCVARVACGGDRAIEWVARVSYTVQALRMGAANSSRNCTFSSSTHNGIYGQNSPPIAHPTRVVGSHGLKDSVLAVEKLA